LDAHFYNVSNATKAQLITSYMKMLKNCPELRPQVATILSQYSDHWDEELQQRACEYQRMLERADEDENAKQLVMNSLDKMPNFSEDLQTNNVLTRRILSLKVKKGFAINQEEAEKSMKQNMAKYTTNVSSALTSNQPNLGNALDGIDLDGSSTDRFKTNQTNAQQQQ
jgi:hypothetical protein